VVARARRTQRRRSLAGLAAVAGATVLAAGLLIEGWQAPGRTDLGVTGTFGDPVTVDAGPDPAVPRLASDHALAVESSVDVIGAGAGGGLVLVTGVGEVIDLGPVTGVVSAHRVGGGWAVVSGEPGTARLWWVSADRGPVSLLAGMDSIAVDGPQVAWRRGVVMFAAVLSGTGQMERRVITPAPDTDGQPVSFAGDTVLLRRAEPQGWDTWRPSLGDYQPRWTDEVLRVYGGLPGGGAVGLVPGGAGAGPCLALLDLERGLAAGGRTCPAEELSADGPAAVSPESRWLLVTGWSPAGPDPRARTLLVDLALLADGAPAGQVVTGVEGVAPATGRPVWSGPDQVLFPTPDGLARLWPERLVGGADGAVELIPLADRPPLLVAPG
jgi:hypothetical protein